MLSKGTPFRPKEMEAFMLAVRDNENKNNIYYEDYVSNLQKLKK